MKQILFLAVFIKNTIKAVVLFAPLSIYDIPGICIYKNINVVIFDILPPSVFYLGG